MRLDLREIIDLPGSSKDFEFRPDFSGLEFGSVVEVRDPVMSGAVRNTAGLLTLSGVFKAELECVCARCARGFVRSFSVPVKLSLAAELEDDENPDIWLLEGDKLDLDEVAVTVFALSLDTKLLCKEDCMGICPRCGKDLNNGPCDCGPEVDPRLAVLGQLLIDNQEE